MFDLLYEGQTGAIDIDRITVIVLVMLIAIWMTISVSPIALPSRHIYRSAMFSSQVHH